MSDKVLGSSKFDDPDLLQRILEALSSELEEAAVGAAPTPFGSAILLVISSRFQGLDEAERVRLVSGILQTASLSGAANRFAAIECFTAREYKELGKAEP